MPHSDKEMISFFLTTKCNLQCKYCYIRRPDFKHQTLDLSFSKAGIVDYLKQGRKPHIRFFGAGEPTCEFDLLKSIFEFSYGAIGHRMTSEIQTNGIMQQEIAEWLRKHIDIVWASSDGTPDIQNEFRPLKLGGATSDALERSLGLLTKSPRGIVGIRMTITSRNLYKQKECISYFKSLGIKHIWADPIFPSVGEDSFSDTLDPLNIAVEFLDARKFAESVGVFYGSILTCNFDGVTKISCRACIPVPHLTSDGFVSACDMALFGKQNNHMSMFVYGKWDACSQTILYDDEKIKYLKSRVVDKMEHCASCFAKDYCAGYCPGEVVNETRDLFGQKTNACAAVRYIFKRTKLPIQPYDFLHP